jgi:hypothetical protein
MKAEELRIGNVIMIDSELEGIITEIRSNHCKVIYYGEVNGEVGQRFSLIPFERIFPSPLNKEWFIKFGFELHFGKYFKGNFHYNPDVKMFFWYGIPLLDSLWNEVHKLQNIYWCLCQEKLELIL